MTVLIFEKREEHVPFLTYFEKDNVVYDNDPDKSWARRKGYDIINVVERKLMTIE